MGDVGVDAGSRGYVSISVSVLGIRREEARVVTLLDNQEGNLRFVVAVGLETHTGPAQRLHLGVEHYLELTLGDAIPEIRFTENRRPLRER